MLCIFLKRASDPRQIVASTSMVIANKMHSRAAYGVGTWHVTPTCCVELNVCSKPRQIRAFDQCKVIAMIQVISRGYARDTTACMNQENAIPPGGQRETT